ncbi:hypothetical protein Hypma_013671 [Hypsizygus marmoreus]|uniref:Uncharacterized protein n=1 Tax=Hypsizygus marmoreus TaxID=39966 RepID=A0A369JB10_HYPMA|nr:hypothetical protein Hypma_013671 [Hypsizygus marmoreus]
MYFVAGESNFILTACIFELHTLHPQILCRISKGLAARSLQEAICGITATYSDTGTVFRCVFMVSTYLFTAKMFTPHLPPSRHAFRAARLLRRAE